MARIRTIKPGFFRSEDVSTLPLRARLTWIGLWTHCDDQGRTKDNVKLIKADVWPLDDVSLRDIEEDLVTLAAHGRIVRYEVDGRRYLAIVNWDEHQSISKPTPSKLPPPPLSTGNGSYPQGNTPGTLPESSGNTPRGKGRERKGREGNARGRVSDGALPESTPGPEPPRTCPQHPNGTSERCGPCKDSRLSHDRWRADRDARQRASPRCRQHPDQLADHCGPCRSEQLAAA